MSLRRTFSITILALAVNCLNSCASAGSVGAQARVRFEADSEEYRQFMARTNGLRISFSPGTDTLSQLEQIVLADLATALRINPDFNIRIQASAQDTVPDGPAPMRSSEELARERVQAVAEALIGSGVASWQLRTDAPFLPPSEWQDGGSAVLRVPRHSEFVYLPPTFVRVRIAAPPNTSVYFIPRDIANRQSPAILCNPPLLTRQGIVGATGSLTIHYPARPIVGVAIEPSHRVRTRPDDIDPGMNPFEINLGNAGILQRC
jgi:hypothetical protein